MTAFVPVLGVQFPWVTIHWIAGLVLLATLIWHVVHVFGWQDWLYHHMAAVSGTSPSDRRSGG